jgi:CubicO group peptidase (beta-lactamase class C family)
VLKWSAIFFVMMLSLTLPARSAVAKPGAASGIEALMRANERLGHFNGVVLVARDGHVVYQRGFGLAEFEDAVPNTVETRFAIASLTKQFTAAAILQLRDAGKLSLEDSICDRFDPCPDAWKPVRIRNLLNHTSGIGDYEEPLGLGSPDYVAFVSRPDNIQQALDQARARPLEFTPGLKWHYSNTGYIVLAKVIERACGCSYASYITNNLLVPAGMTRSGVLTALAIPRLAHGYRYPEQSLAAVAAGLDLKRLVRPVPLGDFSGAHGDAALYSTAGDLARWTEALEAGKILRPSSVDEMLTPGRASYAYGWEIADDAGHKVAQHNGGLPGFASRIEWSRDRHTTVVILSNVEGVRLTRLAGQLTAVADGLSYEVPRAHRVDASIQPDYARLTGSYRLPSGVATVALKNGHFTYSVPHKNEAWLLPETATRFYIPYTEGTAQFDIGPDGRATSLRLRYDGTDIVAPRMP